MRGLLVLLKRNVKLFFKDKGMFLTSLITPAILLLLYATFLGNVYRDSFAMNLPEGLVSDALMNGLVGGQLISSILAVSCVTVSFCSNFLMVQDKANGTLKDLTISPVRPSALAVSYYAASLSCSLIICFAAAALCLVYMAFIGWYLSTLDVIMILLDVILLVLFGTALSSVINFFLSSLGQISAVGTVVSSCYGFLCGAYMPISSFSEGLRNALSLLPGTHGTALLRTHAMRGALAEIEAAGVPAEAVEALADAVDCNVYCFGTKVEYAVMYASIIGAIALLLGTYILLNVTRIRKNARKS